MQMGPTDKDCTLACVDIHGASYVLYGGKSTYKLSDQKMPEKFAGEKVKVSGVLDTKTKMIQVDSIIARTNKPLRSSHVSESNKSRETSIKFKARTKSRQ